MFLDNPDGINKLICEKKKFPEKIWILMALDTFSPKVFCSDDGRISKDEGKNMLIQ